MGRFCIHMAYNGLNYCGWQTQPNDPTVQKTLEEALSTLLRTPIAIMGCGRTDTGVHASDYYAHFDFDDPKGGGMPDNLVFKLNSYLPADLRIFDIFPVPYNFHARFDATARTYRYQLSDQRLPFHQGLYARTYFTLDLDKMNRGAEILMEYEDFTSFAKVHTQVKTNICHLYEAHWDREGELMVFTIKANRFLRNMVRAITGTLIDVGRGALDYDGLRRVVERKDRCAAGTSMPPQALFLSKVDYPWDEIWQRPMNPPEKTTNHEIH